MSKVRSRGGARVDYTDFLSPAAKALPKRSGGAGGGKRKAYDEDAEEEEDGEDDDEEMVAVKPKKATKKPSKPKKTAEVEEETKAKAKPAKKAASAKRRKEEEEEEEEDGQRADKSEEPAIKPKKKAKRETETTAVAVSKARRYEDEVVVRTASTTSVPSASVAPRGDAPLDVVELRKKYDALREFRELETERLLREAKALAKEEKRTYDKLVTKLKDEVATLLTRAQRVDADNKKRHEELLAEHKQRVDALKRDREDAVETNERLRRRIKELEAGGASGASSRSSAHAADGRASITDAALTIELSQAKKLLELYRLVTSTELRLIEAMDDEDDADADSCTDVECAVVDSATGKRFVFDLAVPHDAREEVEYLPSDKPSRDFKTPTYLQEELSFKRSELTKFMRTVFDVVIRKKKSTGER